MNQPFLVVQFPHAASHWKCESTSGGCSVSIISFLRKCYQQSCLCGVNDSFCLKPLEGVNFQQLSPSVERVLGIFVFVSLATQTNADTGGDVLDTALPDVLVQGRVDANVFGSHGLLGKGTDLLDGARSSALELHLVDALGEVDCVIPCDDVLLDLGCHGELYELTGTR